MQEPTHLRILAPGNNWTKVGAHLSIGLTGYYSRLGIGSTVAVVSGDTGQLATDSPQLVADGYYEMGILTPTWYGKMAGEGTGYFDRPLPLCALAAFPHDDRLVLAVREETGIESLQELAERRPALRVSMPPPEWRHPASIVIEDVLNCYGVSVHDFERRGGAILHDRPRSQAYAYGAAAAPVDPSFDAVFDEAMMSRRWQRIFEQYPMRILPIDESVLALLETRGIHRGEISPGQWPFVTTSIPTVDFSGWLLFCRADLPDEIAYKTIAAIDEQKTAIRQFFPAEGSPLTADVDMSVIGQNTGLPLHPGAAMYYAEQSAQVASSGV